MKTLIERFEELSTLEEGWCDGEGITFDNTQLSWLLTSLETYFDSSLLSQTFVYPTIDGKIELEWAINCWEVSLKIDLENKTAYWHSFNSYSDEWKEDVLNLDTTEGWQKLNQKLIEL